MVRFLFATLLAAWMFSLPAQAAPPQTERVYLSGQGPKDAVPWEFFVTAGRRAGQWTTIPVPSNWEQHGFGGYDYGENSKSFNEHGLYRRSFAVPPAWKNRTIKLVFEGVMTDATVKVNGQAAGPTHIGGFYRFSFDVTDKVRLGQQADNLLEVDVAKVSSNARTAAAENKGDYWMFGGIFRPVWLEASPAQAVEHTAIDARADGSLLAEVTLAGDVDGATIEGQVLDAAGRTVGKPFSAEAQPGKQTLHTQVAQPGLWTAETPRLHTLRLTLRRGADILHTSSERFGFRTFEVRKGSGLFLNGKRILLKGVNRHSFRPGTGRALNRQDSYDDARLIKAMNMNTARMSHYPPDKAFLDAADELGLYVLHELSGWQAAHDTEVGRRLVRELVTRDVNHPSILFWDNGNEGGWNRELDGEFDLYDPQRRKVLHPWELHSDIDTKHYPSYQDLVRRLQGPHLVMPTEVLHGLYDGGGGAGLDDYWKAITASPFGAGAIFWVLADEGIARTDRGGRIDVFSTYAPDGLVGPRHEKEGSFHAIRELWSPVQVDAPTFDAAFAGKLSMTNLYDFTSLASCRFSWQLVRYPDPDSGSNSPKLLASAELHGPAIGPGATGQLDLKLPPDWRKRGADALLVTAFGPDGNPLWNWSWALPALGERLAKPAPWQDAIVPRVENMNGETRLIAGDVIAVFDRATGKLRSLRQGAKEMALGNGPRLAFARPKSAALPTWLPFASDDAATGVRRLAQAQLANTIEIEAPFGKSIAYASYKIEISPDGTRWTAIFDGSRRAGDGKNFDFPPQPVLAVRMSGVRGTNDEPIAVKSLRLGYAGARFPVISASATVSSGVENAGPRGKVAWLEAKGGDLDQMRWTLHGDGTLELDYGYTLSGQVLYHGITFDQADPMATPMRWLGQGPYRSWRNRGHGGWLAVHGRQPGDAGSYPEAQGFFANVRWASFPTWTVTQPGAETYLRVGTPLINHEHTSVEFPAGSLSFMHAIPAMGSKFLFADQLGPSGMPAQADGQYRGRLLFRLK